MCKRLVFLALALFLAPAAWGANSVFISQSGAGTQDGLSCANAKPVSYFNNSANWSATPTGVQIGPDTTVHLCGTITGGVGTTALTVQGSGTSGHPVTIVAETGFNLTSPSWSFNGAINVNGKSFITFDGQNTGTIQNTDNGTGLGNNAGSRAILSQGGHDIIIKNWTIANICVHIKGNPGGCSTSGVRGDPITFNGGSNITIDHNTIHDGHWAIFGGFPPGVTTTGWTITNNTIYNVDHGVAIGDSNVGATISGLVISGNDLHDMVNWDCSLVTNPPPVCGDHHDYIHVFTGTNGGASVITGTQIFNNYMHGDPGFSLTGFMFLENQGGNTYTLTKVYNNVFTNSSSANIPSQGYISVPGPHTNESFYNNSINGSSTSQNFSNACFYLGGTGYTIENTSCQNVGLFINWTSAVSVTTIDFNDWFNGGGFYNGSFLSFASWKTACSCDASSFQTNPNVQTIPPFQPNGGSPLINTGTNLRGLGITGLNSDINLQARPALPTNWTIGAANFPGGAGTPALSFSPSPATFGSQNVGTTGSPVTVTVSNIGTGNEVLSTPYFTITGTNGTNFANAGTGTCANGGTIAPSASCTVNLTFTPSATGARTGTLTIQGTVFGTDTLSGTGTNPVIALTPSPATFGNQRINTTSSPLTVTVTNSGTSSQVLGTPYFTITGTNAANFANAGTGTCANGGTIATSGSCTINLTFTPSATGARSAVLTVLGTVSATDNLTGTGTQAALSFSPSPGAFGNQTINTTSSPLTITVTNTGTASEILSTPYFTITGTNASEFVNAGTGTCANGGTIAVSGSCTVNLTFTPTAAGARSANLNIAGSANGLDSLTGTGVAPLASVSPTSIAFGNQTTGTSSGNHAVTLSNTGTATLTISSISLIGADAGQFSTNSSTCGASLAASATCTLNVVFSPTSTGAKTATLRFATNAASSPNDVSLTGTGAAPAVPVLSFSPGLGSFGNQLQGTTSAPITITVSNVGTASEVLANPFFTLTGPNPGDFARTGGTCANNGTIAVSGSCTVIVTFTPTATGGRAASLNILGTANGSVALTGTGTLPVISLSPSPGAFGNQLQGTTSAPLTITVSNTGTGTETLSTPYWTLTGTNPTNFANTGGGTCSNGGSIAPSSSCTVIVTFTPSATGARSAVLNIQGTVNASDSLTGTGTFPIVGIAPSPVGFGNQAVGGTTAPVTVTISNTGTAAEVLATPYFTISGGNASDFANAGTGSCTNGGSIAASGTCTVNLTFTPSGSGVRSTTFSILGTVGASTSLIGTGTTAVVSLSPTSIAFGNQTTGTSSGNQSVTLSNTGNAALTITSIALTGANSNQFSTNASTCGGTLAASSSCTLNVVFSPTTTGAKVAALTFTTSAASSPDNVALTGTGTAVAVPALSFSPSPATFGTIPIGSTSPNPVTVTVTNIGTANEVLSTPYFVIGGANATNFANAGTGTCADGTTILPSGTCTVDLKFTPSATGSRTGTLTMQGTVNGSVNLSGTGVAFGTVTLSPTSINYGNQDDGTSSPPSFVTLTNTGSGVLTITSISMSGTNATEFSVSSDCPIPPQTLAASGTCTLSVVFSPQTAGSKTASVSIVSDSQSSPDSVPLTGTGRVPTPPSTPAPAITIVTILPPGSVVVSAAGMGVSPRNAIASSSGCSQDGITFQNPCKFSISCGNCKNATARFNGTLVSSSWSKGTVTVSVPISLIPLPANATNYQISLTN